MKDGYLVRLCLITMISVLMVMSSQAADHDTTLAHTEAEHTVHSQFGALFASVTEQLANRQQMYIDNPVAYYDFLMATVVASWDSASTSRALVGKQYYKGFTDAQRAVLVDSVDQTLIRYAFEGLESYGGQVFKVDDVVVNEQKGMGWVQVLMESPILPDINLDLVIKRNLNNQWHAVDVRVKGITYVKIKKYKYREIIEEQGFDALIDNLTTKNTDYFDVICAPIVDPKQKGRAPC
ncbi:MAG: ABC transporter substrate-binding protein [Porticoccaceae bacterium]